MTCNPQFSEQLERIKQLTGTQTQADLAKFLGVQQPAISAAIMRGKVPDGWLIFLLKRLRANPEWILSGRGPVYIPEAGKRETGKPVSFEELLGRLPAHLLTDELLRRIKASQQMRNKGES